MYTVAFALLALLLALLALLDEDEIVQRASLNASGCASPPRTAPKSVCKAPLLACEGAAVRQTPHSRRRRVSCRCVESSVVSRIF